VIIDNTDVFADRSILRQQILVVVHTFRYHDVVRIISAEKKATDFSGRSIANSLFQLTQFQEFCLMSTHRDHLMDNLFYLFFNILC